MEKSRQNSRFGRMIRARREIKRVLAAPVLKYEICRVFDEREDRESQRAREEGESEIERERERGSESDIERGMEKSQRVREKEKGVRGIIRK